MLFSFQRPSLSLFNSPSSRCRCRLVGTRRLDVLVVQAGSVWTLFEYAERFGASSVAGVLGSFAGFSVGGLFYWGTGTDPDS
ncbi:hypothetical protein MtrunA17_Chr8g0353041 [Medicago truncatula]|uniref:Transmembrane protein n=1 Tax=Medicago truncatula TaxID=3880 RepID=A0A396GGZ1_MEDTR|nr:hypothetical protein MtrunA17_Chr8g0353041 [Medicago truncatula]